MARHHRGNRDLIKEINSHLIFSLIRSAGPLSRSDLARRSGLSPATISGLTAEMIERDLVREIGAGQSTGGRRPVLLQLNQGAGYVVGIKLMEHAVTSTLTDLDATVLHYRVTPLEPLRRNTEEEPRTAEEVLQTVIEAIEATIIESGVDRQRVFGIGVGMAGVVDGKSGICRYSPFFGWRDAPFAAPLVAHFGMPVYLENDVNTLTIAHQWFGLGSERDHFLVVTVGQGIGAGIVLNGQFYRGATGGAGEFGHMTLVKDGPLCVCGKRGCVEALASDPAVVRQARAGIAMGEQTALDEAGPLTLESIARVAAQGDAFATRLLVDSGYWLGVGIATLVNVLNPQLIIISGEGLQAGPSRFDTMREALAAHVFNGLADELEIVIEPAGDDAWARGAACVVLGELFRSPIERSKTMDWKSVVP